MGAGRTHKSSRFAVGRVSIAILAGVVFLGSGVSDAAAAPASAPIEVPDFPLDPALAAREAEAIAAAEASLWEAPAEVNTESVGETPEGSWDATTSDSAPEQAPGAEVLEPPTDDGSGASADSSAGDQAPAEETPAGDEGDGARVQEAPGEASANAVPSGPSATTTADDSVAAPGLGVQGFYGLEEFGLREDLSAAVNLANGNLVVRDTDVALNGPGIGLRLDRFYNGLSARAGAYGTRWSVSGGQDIGLEISSSTVVFRAPSGFRARFTVSGSTYTAPSGLNADLVKAADGTYTLTYRSNGEVLRFTAGGYLLSDADRNGNALTYDYNADNTVASITDAAGRVTTFTYSAGRITRITDPAGRQANYEYDGNGRLIRSIDPGNNGTGYAYDTGGRLTQITTPRGSVMVIGYDTANRVTSIGRSTDFNSTNNLNTTTFAYNSGSTVQTNPLGRATTYTLDSSGRVTRTTDPLGRAQSQTFTANSSVATSTDAMGTGGTGGNITSYSYDSANNPTQIQAPTGATSTAVYGPGGACGSTDSGHTYQPKCTTDPAGNRTAYTYDGPGNVTRVQDTTGGATGGTALSYTYQRPASATTGTTCGAKPGQMCSATDGKGAVTTYAYDSSGNVTSVTAPAPLAATSYTYDSLGRLATATDASGTTSYGYDVTDHVVRTTVPVPPNSYTGAGDRSANYDADGNLTYDNGPSYSYDAQNRAFLTFPTNDSAGNGFRAYFDAAGNMARFIDNINRQTTYTYDNANQLTGIAEPGYNCDNGANTGCTRYTYNNNGNQLTATFPGGTVETTTRDNSGRATRIRAVNAAGTVLSDLAYSYTAPGQTGATADRSNIQTRTDNLGVGAPAGSITTYGYDTLARLTAATERTSGGAANASWAYTYDKAGNRLSQTRTGSTGTGTTAGTTNYGYNAADQLTTINNSTSGLTYNSDGDETASPGAPTLGVPSRTAAINGDKQISSHTTTGTGAGTFNYSYEGANSGNNKRNWANGTTSLLSTIGIIGRVDRGAQYRTNYLTTPTGRVIAQLNNSRLYQLTDNLGSVVALIDTNGTKVASYAYDPYGVTRLATSTTSDAAANPLRYTGAQLDAFTGLYKLGYRYYDPTTGRFTQRDPSNQEQNSYLYTAGNPINATDLTGLKINYGTVIGGIAGAVAGGVAAAALCSTGIGCLAAGAFYGATFGGGGAGLGTAVGGGSDRDVRESTITGALTGLGGGLARVSGTIGTALRNAF